MRKLMIAAATLATISIGSTAYAAQITATITRIDVKARIIIINGRTYHVPKSVKIGAFKVGQKVTVVYEVVNGQLRVVSIRIG